MQRRRKRGKTISNQDGQNCHEGSSCGSNWCHSLSTIYQVKTTANIWYYKFIFSPNMFPEKNAELKHQKPVVTRTVKVMEDDYSSDNPSDIKSAGQDLQD